MTPETRPRWPLWAALAAGCLGSIMLLVCFARYWPATYWTVQPRSQLIDKGRQVASRFGLNTDGWKALPVANVAKPLAYFVQQHPGDTNAHDVSPLALRITYAAKDGEKEAEVWMDSAGLPLRWHAPSGFKQHVGSSSGKEAAEDAFRVLAGAQAGAYGSGTVLAGDEPAEQEWIWKKPPARDSTVRERITVVMKGAVVRRAEHTVALSPGEEDSDGDAGDNKGYWDAIDVAFGLICATGIAIALGIYVLWRARRAASHRFPLRITGAALLVMVLALAAGSAGQRLRSQGDAGVVFGVLFLAGAILCLVVAGRGISADARWKWISLEQLCGLAPVAKFTGEALAAGLLCSPLVIAIPFVVAACGAFPHSFVLASHADVLYSGSPLLDSIDVPGMADVLGFFGFGMPALRRFIRARWLCWLITIPLGAIYFAERLLPSLAGPLFAPLTAALASWAIFAFVYEYFDLLAVLTVQISSAWLLSTLMLLQKGFAAWPLILAYGCLIAAAWGCLKRGQPVAQGDPLATIPTLIGFRAEREKLKAEFSVARRAQQDMLPQSAPHIPGYSIAASCTPSLEVGGDLYDFLKLPDGRIGIGVADVSGKGVPAALYMTLTKGLLASVTKNNAQLESVVEEVNRHLHGVTRKKVFVTMALGFLDAENGVLECVRAGHNPVMWRQAARNVTTLIAPGGLGLGITANRIFSTQLKVAEMVLAEGDAVVFYSDGITEAMNSGLEQFGEQRLIDAVEKVDNLDAAAARDSILEEVKEFLGGVHPQDDMTLVVLRVGVSH